MSSVCRGNNSTQPPLASDCPQKVRLAGENWALPSGLHLSCPPGLGFITARPGPSFCTGREEETPQLRVSCLKL